MAYKSIVMKVDMIESPNLRWQRFLSSLTNKERKIAACWLPQQLDGRVSVDAQIQTATSYLERKTNGHSS